MMGKQIPPKTKIPFRDPKMFDYERGKQLHTYTYKYDEEIDTDRLISREEVKLKKMRELIVLKKS